MVKQFAYRGNTVEFSNRYHTNGPTTITLAEFETLADAVVADENPIYFSDVTIVRVDWADASTATSTNPHGLVTHTKAYSQVGFLDTTGGTRCPGDCAIVARWSTDARTSKNHPIYLFNFFHGAYRLASGGDDTILTAQASAVAEYASDWLSGFSDGTNTHIRCGPRGAVAQDSKCLDWVRHRDFPT